MIQKIICHKCNRPVERLATVYYPQEGQYKFTVRCHGQIERQILPQAFIDGSQWKIVEIHAFRTDYQHRPPKVIDGVYTEVPTKEEPLKITYSGSGHQAQQQEEQIMSEVPVGVEDWMQFSPNMDVV